MIKQALQDGVVVEVEAWAGWASPQDDFVVEQHEGTSLAVCRPGWASPAGQVRQPIGIRQRNIRSVGLVGYGNKQV
eukprot:9724969-Heterocapsa_arctica.AAC.1